MGIESIQYVVPPLESAIARGSLKSARIQTQTPRGNGRLHGRAKQEVSWIP